MGETQSKSETAAGQSANHTSSEPSEVVTLQTCDECVETIRGKDGDRRAWHIILVPLDKDAAFRQKKTESWIQITDIGRNIRYRDRRGAMRQASGYGYEPSELVKWISENYDPRAIDETTPLTYTTDDIRLCTIQSTMSLATFLYYHRHERFHYIKLSNDLKSRPISRIGIKSFDRIIEFNGINIEGDTVDALKKTINNPSDSSFQLLVCSPATYAHYKSHKKHLHSNLPTVQQLEPMQDGGDPEQNYEIVQEDGSLACITLVNSMHTVQSSLADSPFTTAQVLITMNPGGNKILPVKQMNPANNPEQQTDANQQKKQRETERLMEQLTSLLVDNRNPMGTSLDIHQIRCYGCGTPRIYEDRYKCLECTNYDLCGVCFDQRCETDQHTNAHAMVHFSDRNEIFGVPITDINTPLTLPALKNKYANEEHRGVRCNYCSIEPIRGLRFKCDTCYDYDMCIKCVELRVHDQTHPLLAIGKNYFTEIPMSDIELKDELGRGGFGTVYKARWISKNQDIACKVIDARPEYKHHEASFRKELAAYAELSGPFILKTHGYNIQQLSNGVRRCGLVMEFMTRGSLTSVLHRKEKISLRRKVEMAIQIASGMRKIHVHRMIHRDIRPDNILVTQDYTAKIGDMGLARVWLPDAKLTTIGCLPYMPLEFYSGKYDQSLDVYTYGLTINELFTHKMHKFDFASRRAEITNPSPIFSDLIARCIDIDPKQRPTAIEIETTLRMNRQAIEKCIRESSVKYATMSTEEKDTTFMTVYNALQPELGAVLKDQFPPPAPVENLVNPAEPEAAQLLRLLELLGIR